MPIKKREAAKRLADALCQDLFLYCKAREFVDSGATQLPQELATSISEARGLFRARVTPEHFVVLEDALTDAGLGSARRDPSAKKWTVMPPPVDEPARDPLHWSIVVLLFLATLGIAAALLR